jgi:hypothetical protein
MAYDNVGEKTCLGMVVYFTIRANFVGIFLEHTQNTHTKTHEETAREMNGWDECKRVQRDDLLHDNYLNY